MKSTSPSTDEELGLENVGNRSTYSGAACSLNPEVNSTSPQRDAAAAADETRFRGFLAIFTLNIPSFHASLGENSTLGESTLPVITRGSLNPNFCSSAGIPATITVWKAVRNLDELLLV